MAGEPVGTGTAGTSPVTASSGRPTGVTILAILNWLFAAGLLLGGVLMFALGGLANNLGGGNFVGSLLAGLGAIAGVFFLIFAAIVGFIGWGLWDGQKWAWVIEVVFQGLSALSGLLGLLSGDFETLVSLAIAALILWYLFQDHVKAFFDV